MKRLITLLMLVAFTTATLPVNAFGPTPGQLEYQNNGYSPPYNQYGSFSPTPQQNQYNGYDSYNQYNDYNSYNQNRGSFGSTPQQGWGNTNPDGSFYVPQSQCNHSGATNTYVINRWYKEYSDNRHIEYKEYEMSCSYCHTVLDHYTQDTYEEHRFNNYNQCSRCEYNAGCNHQWTSKQTAKYWYEVYDGYYHSEVYIEEEVCNNCGDVLGSQQKSKIWSHQYQNGKCWECGYIQQSSSQPQYTPPVVNQPEYIEQEIEEEYVEESVYVEPPQNNTTVLPYQQALEERRAYAVTPDGLHINKRNYAPSTALGYADEYYCSINSIYAPLYLPADEVYEQKGDYLYRVSTGEKVSASPSILRICDARISELKSILKGLSDASSRVEQYKQVKKGQIPLTSIAEQNRSYIAKSNQSHSKVSEVQAKLQQLGYASQKDVTGKIDTKTLNNIAYFQSQNGILSTGWLDNETYNAIMSYGISNFQVIDTSPYAEITNMYLENKELVISVQGNQYVKNMHIMPMYSGSIVCGRSVYNTNSATVRIPITQSGQYVIELSVNNGNGQVYDVPKQEIYIDLPKSILEKIVGNVVDDVSTRLETFVGIESSVFSNLVLEPVLDLTILVEKLRYGYSDSEASKQEIIDLCRNGIAQYINDPSYYYAGQTFGDIFSIGAEIYLGGKAVKGIITGGTTLKNGLKLYKLKLVTDAGEFALAGGEAVVVSGAQALGATGIVGIVSNRVLGTLDNIQNAITGGNSSSGNDASIQKAIDIANQVKANNGNAPSGYKGGGRYQNIPLENGAQKLPEGVNYREYDINPYVKGQNRGAERIVIGDDGSVWYTNDHYYTFTRIQ